MPVRTRELTELETRSYVRRTPAGRERIVDLYLESESDRFATLSMPVDLTADETAYLSSELRQLASGFAESAEQKPQE